MKTASIKINYIYNLMFQILSLIIPFITVPYISRIFGAEGVGIQSYTNSIVAIFVLFATFGTSIYGQREIAINRDDKKLVSKLFWEIELLNIVCTSICLVAWIIFIIMTDNYKIFYSILSLQILAVAFDISWLYAGYEQFKYITLRNSIVKIVGIILIFTLVHNKSDLWLYITIKASTELIGNISMWTYLRKMVEKVKIKELNIFRHFSKTAVYFVPALASSVYTVLDKAMIGTITNDQNENGYYEQASKIVDIGKTLVFSLNTVMYARMSYIFAENKVKEMKELLIKSLNFIFLIGISISFGIIGIANNFVPCFFGNGYEKVVKLLYIYSSLIIITGLSNCLNMQYLTPSGQRARSSKALIFGAIVNFTLNIMIIPVAKSIGATLTSVIAELIVFLLYFHMTDKFITWKELFKMSYKKFIAGIVMLIIVLLVGNIKNENIILTLVVQVTIGVVIYPTVILLLRDEFTLEYVRKYWNKIRQQNKP